MAHYSFRRDLKDAKKFEDEMEKTCISQGLEVERCSNADGDLYVTNPATGKRLLYECKDDLMASETGNIAIEFESRVNLLVLQEPNQTSISYELLEITYSNSKQKPFVL